MNKYTDFDFKYPNDAQPYEEFRFITEREIPEIVPYYMISNYGRVWNCKSGRYLSQTPDKDGYLRVGLILYPLLNDKKIRVVTRKVHRLIMLVFNYYDGCKNMVVNHLNNVCTDNYIRKSFSERSPILVSNLEWCTAAENSHHAKRIGAYKSISGSNNVNSKLTEDQVEEICKMLQEKISIVVIAKKYGVSATNISDIKNGKIWTSISCKYNL